MNTGIRAYEKSSYTPIKLAPVVIEIAKRFDAVFFVVSIVVIFIFDQ